MMTRARDKSREMEQVGSVDLSYTENALQFTDSINKLKQSLPELRLTASNLYAH